MNNANNKTLSLETELKNAQFSIRNNKKNEYEKDLKGGLKLVCLLDSCECVFPRIEDVNGNIINIFEDCRSQKARYKKITEIPVFKEFLSLVENGQFNI